MKKHTQIVKMDKSILEYFRMVMNVDNQSKEYREVTEKEFIDELTKLLNCGVGNKEIVWVQFVLLKIVLYLCKMKKPCKECPHLIRNRHNDMIVEFGKRTGKKHNCHMTEGKKDLWNVTDNKLECYGSRNV